MVFKSRHSEISPILTALVVWRLFQSLLLVTQTKHILLLSQPRDRVLGQPQGSTLNMIPIHCHGHYYSQLYTINIPSWKAGTHSLEFIWVALLPLSESQVLGLRYTRLDFRCLTKQIKANLFD